MLGQAFQQPRGQRALAAAGGAGQQQALPHRHQGQPFAAVQPIGQENLLARIGLVHLGQVGFQPQVHQFGDAHAPLSPRHKGSGVLQPGQGVCHRDRHPAKIQEGKIVLGIPHCDNVAGRDVEFLECGSQPAFLVDTGRQHHHGALVEDDLQLQPQVAYGGQHLALVRLPACDDHAPHRQGRHPGIPQPLGELRRGSGGQRPFLLGRGLVEQRAVLGHDQVEQVQAGHAADQVVQLPSRDQDQLAAGPAQALQGCQRRCVHLAVMGDGAIVVGSQGNLMHGAS